ncbi:MAG: CHASE domain-containing protein, partial [Gallionellaceae bacterium]|nr:CHASE domain-containing protein [Gallionellaceae bacterium]
MTDPAVQPSLPAGNRKFRLGWLLPWLVAAVGLLFTYQLWKSAQDNALRELEAAFEYNTADLMAHIEQRMKVYEQVLRGVDGLFAHAGMVTRKEYSEYINRLHLKEIYPGIQGIRFSPLVPLAEKERHIATLRKQGLSNYAIHPEGERDFYTPVIYVEPFDERNEVIFGYDTYSDQEHPKPGDATVGPRRTAMERARDTGNPAISAKIQLLFEKDDDKQAGFLMYLPVYRHGAPHGTLEERRANIIGWISMVFRMKDLMSGALPDSASNVDVEIYDGLEPSDKALMYDADGLRHGQNNMVSRFQEARRIEIGGHTWMAMFYSLSNLERQLDKSASQFIGITGTATTLLLALLTLALVYGRERALQGAAALQRESYKSQLLLSTASDGICVFDSDGNVMQVNTSFCTMLGYTEQAMRGMNIAQWNELPLDELLAKIYAAASTNMPFEARHQRRNGSMIDVEISASTVEIEGRHLVYKSVRDITERKKTEAAIRESEAHMRSIFEGSPIAIWEEDFSAVKARLDELRQAGVTDLRAYLDNTPDETARIASLVKVLRVNEASAAALGAVSKEQVLLELPRYFNNDSLLVFKEELIALAMGETSFRSEIPLVNLKGERVIFDLSLIVETGHEETWSRVLVSFFDITKRKKTEMAM